ncbi:MAG: dihydrofolate synthase [Coriobacteriia bacterium]|nr:dihydrofolate synthase [Coriobacteriia bacterium]
MPAWSYADALAALSSALKFGIRPSLDGIRALAAGLGDPQDAFRSVQVTGTNGKTSVTWMLSALLGAQGLRAGAYTSPHLRSYTERIAIDGRPVEPGAFADAMRRVWETAEDGRRTTEFELLTAAALLLFAERGVHVAVLEVGMGGRWDATSVVAPAVSVVTGVGLDHAERLGGTLAAIAEDKAHVIKRASAAVVGPGCGDALGVVLERARLMGAPATLVLPVGGGGAGEAYREVRFDVRERPAAPGEPTRLRVAGRADYGGIEVYAPSYQAPNAAVAVAAAEAVAGGALEAEAVRSALAGVRFPGRFELACRDPVPVVLDGAHNPQAAARLAGAVEEAFGAAAPDLVLGVCDDKDAEGIAAALAPAVRRFVCTRAPSARAMEPRRLAEAVENATGRRPLVRGALPDALDAALALPGSRGVLVAGSLYLAGAARQLLC